MKVIVTEQVRTKFPGVRPHQRLRRRLHRGFARSGIPLGAYDLDRVEGDIILRRDEEGEAFHGIGQADAMTLTGGEVVLADQARVISFYPHATRTTRRSRP